jgi:hypothetical protein
MQQRPMRKPRPFQWIEEAEARQVATLALSEAPAVPALPCPARAATTWRSRIRRWGFAPATGAIAVNDTTPDTAVKPPRR